MRLQTPKGFRDFLPQDAIKRKFVVDKITEVFQKFGFDPLETPTLEYAETLKGKYGEEEKLIYEFTDRGGDQLAMRYDQTVPVARVIAQYGPMGLQKLPIPFKRYQIQSAFRGENTQKGRYREFLQCDADIIGVNSPEADAEILTLFYQIYENLGLKDIKIYLNDRSTLIDDQLAQKHLLPKDVAINVVRALDKLDKLTPEQVIQEMVSSSRNFIDIRKATQILESLTNAETPFRIEQIIKISQDLGVPKGSIVYKATLARGLDYYTGIIFEAVLPNSKNSLGGGGRYDNLIEKLSGSSLPAVGFAIGFDRTIEAMEEMGILTAPLTNTEVLVTVFNSELMEKSLEATLRLRSGSVNTEVWLDPSSKLDKQLKYADQKGIPYVIIIGPEEAENETVTLKNLNDNTQQVMKLEEVNGLLRHPE